MPYHTIDSMNWCPKDDATIPRWVTIKNCACRTTVGVRQGCVISGRGILRVASCKLRVRVASANVRVASFGLRVQFNPYFAS